MYKDENCFVELEMYGRNVEHCLIFDQFLEILVQIIRTALRRKRNKYYDSKMNSSTMRHLLFLRHSFTKY